MSRSTSLHTSLPQWLIKGQLLVGGHPGNLSTSQLVQNLSAIMGQDLSTFVCLQEEMPPDAIEANAAAKCAGAPSDRASKNAYGLRTMNAARPYIDDARIVVDRGVQVSRPLSYLRLPIPEGSTSIIDDRQLMAFVESLVSHIKADDGIYMHCDDGNGRTGTVASLLLGVLYGLGSSEAMDCVLRFRNQRSSGQKGDSPETHEQKMQVHRILQDRGWLEACRRVGVQSSADPAHGARGEANKVQEKLRTILARRGAKGIIGLGRSFKVVDDDRSGQLSPQEFSKAMRDFGMGITDHEVAALFKIYDTDGSGGISFNEFLHGLRGPMNPIRLDLVYQAFRKMDRTGDGVITIEDLQGVYNAREHPDVKAGRKTEREIMGQFLDSFDVGNHDGVVTRDEFEQYYSNVSASIDDDAYFKLMMWNAWGFGKDNQKPVRDAWANDEGAAGTTTFRQATRAQGRALRTSHATAGGARTESGFIAPSGGAVGVARESARVQSGGPPAGAGGGRQLNVRDPHAAMDKVRAQLAARGARGIFGFQRQFKIMDDDGNKRLNYYEFNKGMKDFGVKLSDADVQAVFSYFDVDGSGGISFDEFMIGLKGQLNDRRRELIHQAFMKLDVDGSGYVDVQEIANLYNADKHPEVQAGKKTAEEVFREFLDTFDGGQGHEKDGEVHLDEFEDYYRNISASIDDDNYFQLMMWNVWNLGNKAPAAKAWSNGGASGTAASSAAARRTRMQGGKGPIKGAPMAPTSPFGIASSGGEARRGQRVQSGAAPAGKSLNVSMSAMAAGNDRGGRGGGRVNNTFQSSIGFGGADTALTEAERHGSAQNSGKLREEFAMQMSMRGPRRGGGRVQSGGPGSPGGGAAEGGDPVSALMDRLRDQLASRGARGIHGLGRVFKIFDDDGSGDLNYTEFTKAMRDYGMALSEEQCHELFARYDRDGNGAINYNEFIRGVRGRLNATRKNLVHQAFRKFDRTGNGVADLEDLRGVYDASKHPDVRAGKKSEDEVLAEFLDTFDVGDHDGKVTVQEFEDYYSNVSASIDDDNYFQLMIFNAWNLGNAGPAKAAWGNGGGGGASPNRRGQGSPNGHGRKSDFSTSQAQQRLGGVYKASGKQSARIGGGTRSDIGAGGYAGAGDGEADVGLTMERLRTTLAIRGAKGIIGLGRSFRIMDDDGSKSLSPYEFSKAMADFGMSLSEAEVKAIFAAFDGNHDGVVSYDEFLHEVKGPMNPARKALVAKAFAKLDKTGDGQITIDDIAGTYNARKDPRVISGKKTENEVLAEFLDTFDVGNHDGMVSPEEFEQYYSNVSASIDDDAYFSLMMWNAWNLGNKGPTRKASGFTLG